MSLLEPEQRVAFLSAVNDMWTRESGEFDWSEENAEFVVGSGWQDYLLAVDKLPEFPDHTVVPVVKDGQLFMKFEGAISSIYTYKFLWIRGMLPVEPVISGRGHGYDYLVHIDTVIELFISNDDAHGEVVSGMSKNAINNLLDSSTYGVHMTPYIVTYMKDYNREIRLFPEAEHDTVFNVAATLSNKLDLTDNLDRFHNAPAVKVPQYHLPDPVNARLIIVSGQPGEWEFKREALKTLDALGLLSKIEKGDGEDPVKDPIKHFANHIVETKYLRYPIELLGSLGGKFPITASTYQSTYTKLDNGSPYLHDISDIKTFKLQDNPRYSPLKYKSDRLYEFYKKRMYRIASEILNVPVESISTTTEGHPFAISSQLTMPLPEGPWVSQIISIIGTLSALDVDMPDYRANISSREFPKRFSIHGFSFLSDEILRIFHNTPLASAIESGSSEYDPPWLTTKDTKLIQDLLSGRIMPRVFMDSLSNEAFTLMSGDNTFIYFYSSQDTYWFVDKTFTLGERLVNYLPESRYADQLTSDLTPFVSLLSFLK